MKTEQTVIQRLFDRAAVKKVVLLGGKDTEEGDTPRQREARLAAQALLNRVAAFQAGPDGWRVGSQSDPSAYHDVTRDAAGQWKCSCIYHGYQREEQLKTGVAPPACSHIAYVRLVVLNEEGDRDV